MTLKTFKSGRLHVLENKYKRAYIWRWSYLQPKHWPVWILLGFVWVLGRLPITAYVWTGKALGRLLMKVLRKRKAIALKNIQLCFPELSEQEREHFVKKNFEYAGIALLEPGLMWFSRPNRIKKLYRIEGLERFEYLRKQGHTILLCGLHMQCLEAMGRILGEHITTNHLYRVNDNPVYEYMSGKKRSAYSSMSRLVSRKNIRDFLFFMKKGQTGSIIPDHDLGRKSSVFVPFFGHQTATVPSISVCAAITRAKVVMIDYFFDDCAKQYVFRIGSALENFPTKNREVDTSYINQLIEEKVREHPEQYLWMHRRFKTRQNVDDPSLYK